MTTTTHEDNPILNTILLTFNRNDIFIDNEGLFFLRFICDRAEQNLLFSQENEKFNVRRNIRTDKYRIGRSRKQPIKSNNDIKKRRSIENLSIALIQNAENKIVNTSVIIRTLEKLCPLWPFCR
ncbi:hypothetical protein [Chryseobacterium gambrini]|uniref:hypothetical protein n=1 Tax=Chryseobacterium gambrini TaxID=373672 RepID=UPI003BA47994